MMIDSHYSFLAVPSSEERGVGKALILLMNSLVGGASVKEEEMG